MCVGMSLDCSTDPSPYPSRSGSPNMGHRDSSFTTMELANAEWSQALRELMKGEGYDIRKGMETRIVELEEQLKEEIVKKEEQLEQQRLVRAQLYVYNIDRVYDWISVC